jgi:hypothetical protein
MDPTVSAPWIDEISVTSSADSTLSAVYMCFSSANKWFSGAAGRRTLPDLAWTHNWILAQKTGLFFIYDQKRKQTDFLRPK